MAKPECKPMSRGVPVRIEVTAEDIANGERKNACRCPVALAATRAGMRLVHVDLDSIGEKFVGGVWGRSSYLPVEACEFVDRFDRGLAVEPFIFEIKPSHRW